jgi:hypothetical protein
LFVTEDVGITFRPYPGTTPEQARDTRARAWAYVLSCNEEYKAAGAGHAGGDDAKGSKHVRARDIIPKCP